MGAWGGAVQEKRNETNPGRPFPLGINLRGWVLYYMSVDFVGIKRLGQDEPWDQMEYIRLE